MEKINALIDKLLELRNSGADLATISYYVQLLQAEVLHVRARQHIEQLDRNNNVAVILPAQAPIVVNATARTTEPQTTTLPSNNPVAIPVRPAEDINIDKKEDANTFFNSEVNVNRNRVEDKKEEANTFFNQQPANSEANVNGNKVEDKKEEANTFFNHQPVNNEVNVNASRIEDRKEEANTFLNQQPVNGETNVNGNKVEDKKEEANTFFNQQPANSEANVNGNKNEPESKKEINSFFSSNAAAEDINSRYQANKITDINSQAQAQKQEDLNSKFGQQTPEPPVRATPPPPPPQPQPVKPQATLFEITPPPPAPAKAVNQPKEESSSLNERLRHPQVEIAQKLGEMPIKDLRHAIGINDKYQFIETLFNGNSDLYERSIKTINDCHTLQEADYWLQREIKVIQGWQEDHKLVQHFYTLLKKRFS